jgi:GAF domain-containing protein
MQAVCAVVRAVFRARAASVAVVDEGAGEFVFVAAAGESHDLVGARFRTTKGVAGRAFATGEAVVVADTSRDPEFARETAIASGFEPDAIAVVPVTVAGRVSGVLSVLDPAQAIDDTALGRMSVLADHAAAGLTVAQRLDADA